MIKEYMEIAIGNIPLSSVVMIVFFVLFVLIIIQAFKIDKSFVDQLSSIPLKDDRENEVKEGVQDVSRR